MNAPRTPGVPSTSWVHTADRAVPELDDTTADLLEQVTGFHEGLDLMVQGARLLMLDLLSRDDTQSLMAALGGSATGQDFAAVFAAVVARLTDPDTNPCLRDLDPGEQANVRRIGAGVATDIDAVLGRDYLADLSARIDPYTDHTVPPQPQD